MDPNCSGWSKAAADPGALPSLDEGAACMQMHEWVWPRAAEKNHWPKGNHARRAGRPRRVATCRRALPGSPYLLGARLAHFLKLFFFSSG